MQSALQADVMRGMDGLPFNRALCFKTSAVQSLARTPASQDQHQKAPAGRQADVAPMRGTWYWVRGAVRMGRRLCCGGCAASSCRACCCGRADHLPAQCSATLTASMAPSQTTAGMAPSQTTARSTRIQINFYQLSHTYSPHHGQTMVQTWFEPFTGASRAFWCEMWLLETWTAPCSMLQVPRPTPSGGMHTRARPQDCCSELPI